MKSHEKLEAGAKTDRNDKADNDGKEHVDQEEDSDALNWEGVGEVVLQIC